MKSNSILRYRHNRRRIADFVVSTAATLFASVVLSTTHPSAALVTVPKNSIHSTSSPLHRAPRRSSLPPLDQLSASYLTRPNPIRGIKNQLVCYYADEWMDADAELAFHTSSSSSSSSYSTSPTASHSPKSKWSLLRRFLSRNWYQLKESIRTRIERCTVYVLECEDGKYYVGSTTNRKRRFREHARRKGSKWTRAYKSISVLREYRRIPSRFLLGMESRVTAECMLEFGVNNVRGSMFCSTRDFHMGDIDALTKFLGHYNDLNYRKVNVRLSQTLPMPPGRGSNHNNSYSSGKCFTCGELGHRAADCPESHATTLRP